MFIGTLGLAAAALFSPRIADGLAWRFEKLERFPSLSQRSFEVRMERYFLWFENFIEPTTAVFFGDSHLQLIPPEATRWAANFAVNGQPISRMIDRVEKFKSVQTAPIVFINGGENDLTAGASVEKISQSWEALLKRIDKPKKLVCVGLPEASSTRRQAEQVNALNVSIADICRKNGGQFLSLAMGKGAFAQYELAQDNVHLSRPAMYELAKVMQQMASQP